MKLTSDLPITLSQLPSFTSGIVVILLGLMLFMAFRLYVHNRRVTYRKLILSLGLCFLQQLLELGLNFNILPNNSAMTFSSNTLYVLSFIILNFAIFELYHKPRPRTRAWYYSLIGICLAISISAVFTNTTSIQNIWEEQNLFSPVLDVFMLALSPLFALMFAPHIGQPRRYMMTLMVSFSLQVFVLLGHFQKEDTAFYDTMRSLLPIVYYVLFFMLLFERVVELLSTAYRSSITDGLTNLYNRRFFTGQMERAIRSGTTVGAIFCDIDNFKKLNDTQGHHQADIVLKQAAQILMEETDGVGLAGRYGGEELVAFVSSSRTTAAQVAEKIRARIEKETIVTVSVGYCVGTKGTTAEKLMKMADEAMYHSKKSGKNRVTDHSALMHTSVI
ncbi:GGDEF domain-containing protein [Cohnella thailandensis]|uniref:Diguanylate cyclase n=1 Tax=Cohnella thailandensis TaxID=557557 RepID=A0A841SNJ3_9BACL|nr:GGDEF domain-containing protein [Cohnella thailandensis]MBB6634023.1 diguanylate cyclase [Cohnella thailandensis]MBP1972708.1 diguanylate cyclase (GGDEF)-like protein [Cohnella thailandensis]